MNPLAALGDWPVGQVSAAVSWPDGTSTRYGETDRPFPLASVSKLITALATLIAVEEGTVSLDDPVGPPGATLADVLAHASGVGPDDDTVLAAPRRLRIYSNHGYRLAADHVARHAAMSFTAYATEAVVAPMGMSGTIVDDPAAGAVASVDDLTRFVEALRQPILVSTETLDLMRRPHLPSISGVVPGFGRQDPNPWGLGPEVRGAKAPHWTGPTNSSATYGHFGKSGTMLWIDPVPSCALVCLTDRPFGPWATEAWPRLGESLIEHCRRGPGHT